MYKINEIVDKILLTGDTLVPEMHLIHPGFTYSVCEPFTQNKETGDLPYIYHNKFNNGCFQHDIAFVDLENLSRRTSDKLSRDKAFNIAKYPKYGGYQ